MSDSVPCLQEVKKVLETTLGKAEMRQQVVAIDRRGRTILMSSTNSGNADIFEATKCIFLEGQNDTVWARQIQKKTDRRNRLLLHHVASDGSEELVRSYVKGYKRSYPQKERLLNTPDYKGRTALMYALRNKSKLKKAELKKKVNVLARALAKWPGQREAFIDTPDVHGNLGQSSGRSPLTRATSRNGPANTPPVGGLTAIMCAAHGGRDAFDLVFGKLRAFRGGETVSLDFALFGIEDDGDEISDESHPRWKEKQQRCGTLLAEAASGGDIAVLNDVIASIKASYYWLLFRYLDRCTRRPGPFHLCRSLQKRLGRMVESVAPCTY